MSFFSSVRVQDGFLTFRWWRSYVPKDLLEDLSHSDTRVSIQLNGFELHIYNRTSTYKGELFSDPSFLLSFTSKFDTRLHLPRLYSTDFLQTLLEPNKFPTILIILMYYILETARKDKKHSVSKIVLTFQFSNKLL